MEHFSYFQQILHLQSKSSLPKSFVRKIFNFSVFSHNVLKGSQSKIRNYEKFAFDKFHILCDNRCRRQRHSNKYLKKIQTKFRTTSRPLSLTRFCSVLGYYRFEWLYWMAFGVIFVVFSCFYLHMIFIGFAFSWVWCAINEFNEMFVPKVVFCVHIYYT